MIFGRIVGGGLSWGSDFSVGALSNYPIGSGLNELPVTENERLQYPLLVKAEVA